MSIPGKSKKPSSYEPMEVKTRRLFTAQFVKELKILINEVLDGRDGKMDRDSYFDVE